MKTYTKEQIIEVMNKKGYPLFNGPGYDLNIIAIRSKNSVSDAFDDSLNVLYKRTGSNEYELETFKITTDPGKHWLLNPMNINGTLILVPGRYPKAFKIGKHKGYEAFEQLSSMTYVRDNNKDNVLNLELIKDKSNHITGDFSTNIHRASKWRETLKIGKYSAGCQVVPDPKSLDRLLTLGKLQAKHGFGDTFTYVLLNEQDFNK